MLLSINPKGYHQVFHAEKRQEGIETFHYYEAKIISPIVILKVTASVLKPGQIWAYTEWKGRGQPGICRPEHEGLLTVKMYLQRMLYSKSLKEDDQIFPLSYLLDEYRKTFRERGRP